MFTHEQRMAAIKRLIQNRFNYARTILELGYPKSTMALRNWYNEYRSTGEIHQKDDTERKYSKEQRQAAVRYYLENGHSITRTIKEIGYPSRQTLNQWLKEEIPETYKPCRRNADSVYLSQSQKEQAVIDFCTCQKSGEAVAKEHGVTRYMLYYCFCPLDMAPK